MSDEFIGVAVLDTSRPVHWLHCIGRRQNGRTFVNQLPVGPSPNRVPAEKLPSWFPENQLWCYTIAGNVLSVTPSVHMKDYFHNAGQWSLPFVRAEVIPGWADVPIGDSLMRHEQLKRLNPGLFNES